MQNEDLSRRSAEYLYTLQEFREGVYYFPLDKSTCREIKEKRGAYLRSLLNKGFCFKEIGGFQQKLRQLYLEHGIYFGFFEKEGVIYVFCRGTDPELKDRSVPHNIDKVQPGFAPVDQIRKDLLALFLFHFSACRRFVFMGHSMGGSIAAHLLALFLSERQKDVEIDLVLFQPAPLSEQVASMINENISSEQSVYITDFRCQEDLLRLVQDTPYSSISAAHYTRVMVDRDRPHSAFPYDEKRGALPGAPSEDKEEQIQMLIEHGRWTVLPAGEGMDDTWHRDHKSRFVAFLRGCVPVGIIRCLQSCWCVTPMVRVCCSPVAAVKRRCFISPPGKEQLLPGTGTSDALIAP